MLYVDFCAIQNVPSNNINRDDTGAPKTAVYGGVRRARVSSQAWKKAMRDEFASMLPEEALAIRTKLVADQVACVIEDMRPDLQEKALPLAKAALTAAGIAVEESKRSGDDEGKIAAKYLIFISRAEIVALANAALAWEDSGVDWATAKPKDLKKDVAGAFHGKQGIEIALFGRMLADAPDLNVDACAQVAHSISVDRVTQEYDYFTAMDQCAADDNAGAAMIDSTGYNSSTLYRYATVNVSSLVEQLGDIQTTIDAVTAFAEAFIRSMPTGKQNSFANRTLPNAVLVSIRDKQPVNPVSAFEVPVVAKGAESISRVAARKLGARVGSIERSYDMPACVAWNIVDSEPVDELDAVGVRTDMPGLLGSLRVQLAERL